MSSQTNLIAHIVDQIADAVRGGRSPEDAARRLAAMLPAEEVQRALQKYREAAKRIWTMREPSGVYTRFFEPWYLGPAPEDKLWSSYKARVLQRGWDEDAMASLDQASTRVVSLLDPPSKAQISTRGLVVGHVQSGKTANFTAVIAKAADVGYRFFIVLSGLNNALRNQTQTRLESDLVAANPESWISVTDSDSDFHVRSNVNAFLSEHHAIKVLGVVKKNPGRLRKLNSWLHSARPEVLRACPVLVIDDEADQASPNAHPKPEERTAINKLIIKLLKNLPKAGYVGYTATPFANLLIDPKDSADLYPADFIIDLPRGADYFGAEQIFGRPPLDHTDEPVAGLNMIRQVPDDEAHLLKPPNRDARFDFVPPVTATLRTAMLYFWMATSARLERGQERQHCSMLIHTTQYSIVHTHARSAVESFRLQILEDLRVADETLLQEMLALWVEEQEKLPPSLFNEEPVSFEDVLRRLALVITRCETKVENGISLERIDYTPDADGRGRIYIVIGGNVLSRGLTLEGLTVSFFVRSASAYDTLLQMGRWFGYRHGYADLPRVWMTDELKGYFFDLAGVEREIRIDIDRYSKGDMTPKEFGVRIRTHPKLEITSKLKMQSAVTAKMAFSGRAVQTIVFNTQDVDWLQSNLDAAQELLRRLVEVDNISPSAVGERPHRIFSDVSVERVQDFLSSYSIDPSNGGMPATHLKGYIRDQNAAGRILRWNVAVVTREDPVLGNIQLGSLGEVPLINRSRFLRPRPPGRVDIKALMSETDVAIDAPIPTHELREHGREDLISMRDQLVPDRGLLLIYPIAGNSKPEKQSHERAPLGSAKHVIGIALVFPEVSSDRAMTPQTYVTAPLPDLESEPIELEDVADAEDI